MNNKGFFTLLLIILINIFHAQKPEFKAPDYDLIHKNIENKKSEFYYPNLLKQLKENDTVMTAEQYRHLYFGQIFQPDYKPYKISKKMDEMQKFLSGENITEKDLPRGIKLFKEALDENPLDMRAMNYFAYLNHLNNDDNTAKKISRNLHGLLGAILSSGDGLKCETGFHVISVTHEYVLMNMFELESKSQSFDGKCDYQQFEKDKYKIPGMYFNVSKFYGKMFD
ncbi:DUF4919 domain-containing protein [Chryseobacterium sp. MMS23-Vi53]|uniref:DUF4919 domain-containing protein n=1 Tax=Chryseobacterium sp. MMS23-Vi53 TaxID=3386644 RepID=UPI0039E88E54